MTTVQPLDGAWTLRLVEADADHPAPDLPSEIAAVVPGTVHTDLLAAGLIEDPYLGTNETLTAWIGHATWSYRRHFEVEAGLEAHERTDLVLDGLDTVATVLLNGHELLRTANQHRSHRVDVTAQLRPGRNELEVVLGSAWAHAHELAARLGPLPNAYPTPFNFIRKMAANFGWDWGPELVTAGIWRGVRLESWRTARLAEVRPRVDLDPDGTGTVDLAVALGCTTAPSGARVRAHVRGVETVVAVAADQSVPTVTLRVPEAPAWWPRGYGDQPLSELTVELLGEDGAVLDRWRRRIGFRRVRLDTSADEHGSAFTLVVNDQPVFVHGANWIPDDCFLPRVTPERYRARVEQATAANLNLLRVWGGGIFESDHLYDVCDELGVLVWQDFLFACAAYPEEEPLRSEVLAEARENVVRLVGHPSLVLLNGANENVWAHADWDWDLEPGRTWGRGYYEELLPAVVAEVAPGVPYWVNSPWSGSPERHPNDQRHGTVHVWDVWNTRPWQDYATWSPRFVAEFGYQGPPTWATLTEGIEAAPTSWTSPAMLLHQKADDGTEKLLQGLQGHLPSPRDVAEWHYLTQLNQARAVTFAIERFRSQHPVCTGTIVWQLNDCWPVVSWAMVDGYARPKPLWYAVRRVSAPRLLTFQDADPDQHRAPDAAGGVRLVAVNDTGEPWRARLELARIDLDGTRLGTETRELDVAARSTATLDVTALVQEGVDRRREVLVARAEGAATATRYGVVDLDLALTAPELSVVAGRWCDGEARLTLTATNVVRSLSVLIDRLHPDARVSETGVDLLPGEPLELVVSSPEPLVLDDLHARGLVASVNDVLTAARLGAAAR